MKPFDILDLTRYNAEVQVSEATRYFGRDQQTTIRRSREPHRASGGGGSCRALGDHEECRLTGRHHAAESLRRRPPSPGYVGVAVSDRRAIVELYTGAISGWLGACLGCTHRASGG
jgi:hypothetical protein